MKKGILLVLSVVTISTAFGQQKGEHHKAKHDMHPHKKEMHGKKMKSPEERAQRKTAKLDTLLGLRTDQKVKVHAVVLKKHNTVKAIHENHKADTDKAAQKLEVKAARKTYREELSAILTSEQQAKLKAHVEAKRKAKADRKK